MAKTVSLNEFTYTKLASLSGELTALAKKPVSLGMTVHLAVISFEAVMFAPGVKGLWEKILPKVTSPEDFDKQWDAFYKLITKQS